MCVCIHVCVWKCGYVFNLKYVIEVNSFIDITFLHEGRTLSRSYLNFSGRRRIYLHILVFKFSCQRITILPVCKDLVNVSIGV